MTCNTFRSTRRPLASTPIECSSTGRAAPVRKRKDPVLRNFRRFLRGPVGRMLTVATTLASLHAFAEPQNYLTALAVQQAKEQQIREIAAKLKVDPEFLLHPEGRKSFDFRSLFAWAEAKLGIQSNQATQNQQPLDVKASIDQVKSRYALVAADAILGKIADLVRLAGEPAAQHADKHDQVRAHVKSLSRFIDKDLLPKVPDNAPRVAHQRDAQMRGAIQDVQKKGQQVLNAPGAWDDSQIEATLANLKSVVSSSLVVAGVRQRWTRDPFPLKDTYTAAPRKSVGPTQPIGATSTRAIVASASTSARIRTTDVVEAIVVAMGKTLKTT